MYSALHKYSPPQWTSPHFLVTNWNSKYSPAPPTLSQYFVTDILQGLPCIWLHLSSYQLWPASLFLLKKSIPIAWCCNQHVSQWGWCSVRFLPHTAFCIKTKKFNFGLIWPEHFLPHVYCVSHMGCGKLQSGIAYGFLSTMIFLSLFHKRQICGEHD